MRIIEQKIYNFMEYISSAEYWKAEFEANDREFTENGSLYR